MSIFPRHKSAADFEVLAMAQEKKVYLTCLHMLGDPEDARDCAQETMLNAFRAFSGYRGEAQFGTWISRIAVNTCLSHLRRRRKTVSLDALREDGFDPADEKSGVYSRLAQKERLRLVRESISLLTPDMQAVLVLRDIEGRSMEEIASILSLPQGTVKSRLNRARNKLCKILSKNAELFDGDRV